MNSTPSPRSTPATLPRLMRVALAAAHHGHHVIPLWPRSKVPKDKAWETVATHDPHQIHRIWSDRPYNIGIACGPSGLYVLDLDTAHGHEPPPHWTGARHGRDVLARLAQAAGQSYPAHTYTVRSPSGGLHLYFRAPAGPALRNTAGRLGWRVDSRGAGGYIVAAGSATAHGFYRAVNRAPVAALPEWLVPLLTPPTPTPPTPVTRLPPHRLTAYLDAVLHGEADKVRHAPPGRRHHTLLRAAGTLGRWVGSGALDEHAARTALETAASVHLGVDGWSQGEADRTIGDGLAWGIARPRPVGPVR